MHEVKHVLKEYFPEYRQVRRRVTLYSDKHSNVCNNTSSQPWRTHTHRTKGLKELNNSGHSTVRHLTYTN